MGEKEGRSGGWLPIALASVAGLGVGVAGMLAVQGPMADGRVEEIVHNYILENPEILPQAMAELDRRTAAQAVGPRRAQLETPFGNAWAGAEQPEVVLVEFFDYACGFCRANNAVIDRLIREDPGLRVVWRDLPVLGPGSQEAAFASLNAAEQGRFRQFHQALFAIGRPDAGSIAQAMQRAGVQARPQSDAQRQEIARNLELAGVIRATGTPTYVVGDQVFVGAVEYQRLKDAIAQARASRAS